MLNIICYFILAFSAMASTGLQFESEAEAREELAQLITRHCEFECVMQLAGTLKEAESDSDFSPERKTVVYEKYRRSFFRILKEQGVTLSDDMQEMAEKVQGIDLLSSGLAKANSGWDHALVYAARVLGNSSTGQDLVEGAYNRLWQSESKLCIQTIFEEPEGLDDDVRQAYRCLCDSLRSEVKCSIYTQDLFVVRALMGYPSLVKKAYNFVRQPNVTAKMIYSFRIDEVLSVVGGLFTCDSYWIMDRRMMADLGQSIQQLADMKGVQEDGLKEFFEEEMIMWEGLKTGLCEPYDALDNMPLLRERSTIQHELSQKLVAVLYPAGGQVDFADDALWGDDKRMMAGLGRRIKKLADIKGVQEDGLKEFFEEEMIVWEVLKTGFCAPYDALDDMSVLRERSKIQDELSGRLNEILLRIEDGPVDRAELDSANDV